MQVIKTAGYSILFVVGVSVTWTTVQVVEHLQRYL
jgi:hypothetical protein